MIFCEKHKPILCQCGWPRKVKPMKEFNYRIPVKYLNGVFEKPISVKAWETAVPGLIASRPISGSRTRVHLTHKASGSILVFRVKNLATALAMAKQFKPFRIPFTAADPRALYRYFAKFTDRQVTEFRRIGGLPGYVEPERWRGYCLKMVKTFGEVVRAHIASGGKPAARQARSKRGDAWKGKKRRSRL